MNRYKNSLLTDELLGGLVLYKLQMGVKDIPAAGIEGCYMAQNGEMKAISELIGLGRFRAIKIEYKIAPLREDLYKMVAELDADIRQSCVVSLEEMDNHIDEQFQTEFVSGVTFQEMINALEDDLMGDVNLEPIIDGRLEIGRVLYEQLAGAVPPYPRRPEAEFCGNGNDKYSAEEVIGGPFAALAQMKKDDQKS